MHLPLRITRSIPAMSIAVSMFLASSRLATASAVTDINISSYYNFSWTGETSFNGSQVAAAPATGDTGSGYKFANWNGNAILIGADSGVASPENVAFTPIPLTAASDVNGLFNTLFGVAGAVNAQITFTNSLSQTSTDSLFGNQTIRDFNNSTFANDLPGYNTQSGYGAVTAQNWWNNSSVGNNQRLDVQIFSLPASWAGTNLTSITVVNPYSSGGTDDIAISALQVQNVPEPTAIAGLLVLSGTLFSRRCHRK